MLPEHIVQEVKKLSSRFDKVKRNWRGHRLNIEEFMQNVSVEDFTIFRGEIKECFKEHLRNRFSTGEINSCPAPNIDDYAINITRCIRIAYKHRTQ